MPNWERKEIVVRTTATGHELTAPVFVCHGRNERPLAYLQANVHGGELQGNAAILALFDLLEREPPRGSVVLVPRVNPVSANQQVGDYVAGVYDFQSGQNFNRGYLYLTGPSRSSSACYVDVDAFATVNREATLREIRDGFREALRAALGAAREEAGLWGVDSRLEFAFAVQELAIEADVVLDLHTGDRAPRYLYSPEGATAAARAFGIPFVLEVPPRFAGALDESAFVPWHDLAEAFHRLGRSDVPRFV
ncbi:MAG TPA: succinylglutamate desuccinylase/aspartoacylase family protein, partial [Thermoanaerobaculia bacterium]|nr:succinylglutamate desuccinylase/aspartoacylase family protein [Thermoanaerobaculia bacterium]